MSDVEYEKYGVPDGTIFEPLTHHPPESDFSRFVAEFRVWCSTDEVGRLSERMLGVV